MAKSNDDNYTFPEDKARWGFGAGPGGQVTVGPQTVGETLEDGEKVSGPATVSDVQAPRKNGGGTDDKSKSTSKSDK